METKILTLKDYIDKGVISYSDKELIKEAALVIKNGGLAAFPTETVYGLGGNALMKEASEHIYAAKGRPSDNPLIVHIADIDMLKEIASDIPEKAMLLAGRFWPGPMTLIFKKSSLIPYETTGGLDTVAVRYPSHPVAAMLIREAGVPVAAPSANLSGRPSTTAGRHCIEDLDGRVDIIVDGGDCEIGLESTIIDVTGEEPQLLRPGAVTKEMLEEMLGEKVSEDIALKGPLNADIAPRAPGMKYRHYAPKAPMLLVTAGKSGNTAGISEKILELIREQAEKMSGNTDLKESTTGSIADPGTTSGIDGIAADNMIVKSGTADSQMDAHIKRIALLCSKECMDELEAGLKEFLPELKNKGIDLDIKITGSRADTAMIAHRLFDQLRSFDEDGADHIIAEGYPEDELGFAVMNRLKKAAAWQLIEV